MTKFEPVAWQFECATRVEDKGYAGFVKEVRSVQPCMPEGSVRNLEPLFTAAQMQQARLLALEEARAMLKKEGHPMAALKIQVLMYSEQK